MVTNHRRLLAAALAGTLAATLAGCESARFGGRGPSASARVAAAAPPSEPIVSAAPSSPVTAEPLPPPPGAAAPPPSSTTIAGLETPAAVPVLGGSPTPVETLGAGPVAGTNPAAGSGGGASSRSASVGGWTARDASGSCRITLSSTPSLDLYRASAGACPNKDLARVTAWDFRDGEVYLFQPGGAVAARLRGSGGSLAGVLAKSGAPVTLTR